MSDIPHIYDMTMDEWRPATQNDVDELCRIKSAYGHLRLMSQSILTESQKMALGHPHKDAPRDLAAYMAGEDKRQEVEKENRLDAMMARHDAGEPIEQVLDDMEAKRQERPFPSYGPTKTYAQQVEEELVHRHSDRIDTSGTYLKNALNS